VRPDEISGRLCMCRRQLCGTGGSWAAVPLVGVSPCRQAAGTSPSLFGTPPQQSTTSPTLCRLKSVALVCRRLRALCLHPDLIRSITASIAGPRVLPRLRSLLAFLEAHAHSVHRLSLDVSAGDAPEGPLHSQQQSDELAELAAGCLAAIAAGRAVEFLSTSETTPLASAAWLLEPGLCQLKYLDMGSPLHPLALPDLSSLVSLQMLGLTGSSVQLAPQAGSALPPSVTCLKLRDLQSTELPHQASSPTACLPAGLRACLHALCRGGGRSPVLSLLSAQLLTWAACWAACLHDDASLPTAHPHCPPAGVPAHQPGGALPVRQQLHQPAAPLPAALPHLPRALRCSADAPGA